MSFDHVPSTHLTLVPADDRTEGRSGADPTIVRTLRAVSGSSSVRAALLAGAMVVANQVVDAWTEGNVLTEWSVLWLVAFAALTLLAGASRKATAALAGAFSAWSECRRRTAQDEHYWNMARNDPRLMADITRDMAASDRLQVDIFSIDMRWPFLQYAPSH